jgi:hypothetical protein
VSVAVAEANAAVVVAVCILEPLFMAAPARESPSWVGDIDMRRPQGSLPRRPPPAPDHYRGDGSARATDWQLERPGTRRDRLDLASGAPAVGV